MSSRGPDGVAVLLDFNDLGEPVTTFLNTNEASAEDLAVMLARTDIGVYFKPGLRFTTI